MTFKQLLQSTIGVSLGILVIGSCLVYAQQESNLGNLTIRFCNDPTINEGTKSLELDTEPGTTNELCIYLHNSGPTPLIVGLNFVDGTYTADEEQKKACLPESSKELFGKYVHIQDSGFVIQAGQTLKTTGLLTFPEGYAGISNGCITAHLLNQNSNAGMFQVFSRRANFIDVFVSGTIIPSLEYNLLPEDTTQPNLFNHTSIKLFDRLVDNTLGIHYELSNTGNVPVDTTGIIKITYRWFWQLEFRDITTIVSTKGNQPIDILLPSYIKWIGGPLKVSVNTWYNAKLPKNKGGITFTEKTITLSAQGRIWSRKIIGIMVLLILMGVVIKRKKNKSPQ
ncbi:MAG TPA: hypothetical protein PK048_00275 [Candidatus Absconditabacterales bacterium]|nr:hypothetical protein [Candidatus Absconditabacterales bacterium]